MPNQSDPNQPTNQTVPQSTGVVPPVFPSQTDDVSPFPTNTAPPTNQPTGSAAPLPPEFSVVSGPKKKFGTGKIIASILGLFILIGGVGAGVLLTKQQQILQPKADTCGGKTCDCSVGATRCSGTQHQTCNAWSSYCPSCGVWLNSPGNCTTPAPTTSSSNCTTSTNPCAPGGGEIDCRKWVCPQGDTNNDGKCQTGDTGASYTDYTDCSSVSCGSSCCQIDWLNGPGGGYCIQPQNCKEIKLSCTHTTSPTNTPTPTPPPVISCGGPCGPNNCGNGTMGMVCYAGVCRKAECPTAQNCQCAASPTPPLPTHTPTPTPTPTPTLTPTPAAPYCAAVKAYDVSWNALTNAQLSSLTAGTSINFCVTGTAPSGTFDMARFTIDGIERTVTTLQRPGSTDFCQSYTILSTDTTVTVSALIHHSTLGWF